MTTRRDFLHAAGGALLGRALVTDAVGTDAVGTDAWGARASGARHDLVIRGGTVFDGTGAPGIEADVAIDRRARSSLVTRRIADAGAVEIDARGLAVAPGFVDIHSHADGSLFADPRAESVVRQGITTVVVGQDGSSSAPGAGSANETFRDYFARVDRLAPGGERRFDDRARHGARRASWGSTTGRRRRPSSCA